MSFGTDLEAELQDLRNSLPEFNIRGHRPPPGEMHPEKYPYVGPHYQGEVPNYIYDSATDTYREDPKYVKDFNYGHGFVKKPPSFLDQLLPVLGATGAAGLVQGLVRDPSSFLGSWGDVLGLGGKKGGSSGISSLFGGNDGTSSLGNFDLGGSDGLGQLDFGQGGNPLEANPFSTSQSELANSGGMFGPEGGFASYGIPALAALGTYYGGKSILDGFQGNQDDSTGGKYGRGQAAFSTMGASELAPFLGKLFGGGHSQNYFDGKSREDFLNSHGGLHLDKTDGGTYDLSAEQYRKDPSTYNFSGQLGSDASNKIIDASNPLGYLVTKDSGTQGHQFQQALAEAMQQGADPRKAFEKYGYDYNKAKDELNSSGLDQPTKDAYLYGLNQTWGMG